MATRPDAVRVAAPAKINLFLHVTGKRADGYHDLQSLVAFADVGDVLVLEPAESFSLTIEGPFAANLASDADNLVLRAARLLASRLSRLRGAHFRLIKNLPVASGIGGGSADAAAALRGLLALDGQSTLADLDMFAASLGSDVPVCLKSGTAWMEGRGEHVTRLPALPKTHMVLVNPGVSVSTADVFRRLAIRSGEARLSPPTKFTSFDALVRYLETTRNDLEAPALAIAPVIGTVLDALSREGAALARMSGSGATCFGLFETPDAAREAHRSIHRSHPDWWVCLTALADSVPRPTQFSRN